MKQHSAELKQEVVKMGKQIDSIITYEDNGQTVTLHDELYAVTLHYKANILKSVMKQLDVESSVDIPLDTVINYQLGVKVGNVYEYLDYGNYIIYKSEIKEDTKTYLLTCYDKMLYSMKDYESLNITYPITIRNYINAICNKLGLTFKSINDTFANYSKEIPAELYLDSQGNSLGYTFRDVLDELAQVTASIICIDEETDQLEIRYPYLTSDTINEDFLKDINVNFGEKYGPINTIVLSRSSGADNIYYPDPLPQNPIEIKIKDNQIMNGNNRDTFMPDIYTRLNGLEYYINNFTSPGILYLEVGDFYTIQIGQKNYKCLMLNDEINVTQGIEEIIHTDMPEQSKTDYSKADKTDRRINQTYFIVDKQNQTIESVVSETIDTTNPDSMTNKVSRITQTVNELNSKIQDIADITTQQETIYATLDFEGINQSEPIEIKIHPTTTNISYLYPRDDLYPSDTLYMPNRILRFTNTKEYIETTDIYYTSYKKYYSYANSEYTLLVAGTDYTIGNLISGTIYENKYIDYELPDDLLIEPNSGTYDEFYLGYDEQVCQVTKRCKYNADGTVGLLSGEEIHTFTSYPSIPLTDGDYTIELLGYSNGYMSIRLMAQNIYTTQFATKAEMNSEISQTAQSITSTVSATYETKQNAQTNYSQIQQTATSLQSQINANDTDISTLQQTAQGLTSEVSQKVGNNEVISKINQSSEAVTILANKLGLTANDVINIIAGNIINLTSKNIVISSDFLDITKYGKMKLKGSVQATDLLRIENTNGNDFAYYAPDSWGIVRTNGSIYATAQGGNFYTSTIELIGTGGTTEVKNTGIITPTVTQTSKEENKKNFEKLENGLNIIQSTDIYKYNMKSQEDGDKKHIGFVIGDKYKYSEEITSEGNDGVDTYSMISVAYKAIQELAQQNEQLQKEIQELKGEKEND